MQKMMCETNLLKETLMMMFDVAEMLKFVKVVGSRLPMAMVPFVGSFVPTTMRTSSPLRSKIQLDSIGLMIVMSYCLTVLGD
jgi:hypothetical protein